MVCGAALATLFVFVVLNWFACCSAIRRGSSGSIIPLGSTLTTLNQTWLSNGGKYELGFYSNAVNAEDLYSVGIWYAGVPPESRMVIWSAGQDVRVTGTAAVFLLTNDGDLVLQGDADGAWRSNTSGLGVHSAVLHDNGNLVLTDQKGKVVWESFWTPTDTLVAGQRLSVGGMLRAASGGRSTASYYSLVMDPTGNLMLRWESSVTYWSTQGNGTDAVFAADGVLRVLDVRGNATWKAYAEDHTDTGVALRVLRLDTDGNLRMYSWVQSKGEWVVVWQAVVNQCHVFATCGEFGVCSFNSTGSICTCPFGVGKDGGCTGSSLQSLCHEGTAMVTMNNTFIYPLYPPQDINVAVNNERCKQTCLTDPECVASTALSDGSGLCSLTKTQFISGYSDGSVSAVAFIKMCLVPRAVPRIAVPPSQSHSSEHTHEKSQGPCRICIVDASVTSLLFFLALQGVVLFWLWKKRKVPLRLCRSKDAPASGGTVRMLLTQVEEMTSNFKNRLGSSVFVGDNKNKCSMVVVKQLEANITEKQLRMTVAILGSVYHKNLVQLRGFCIESNHRFLIYEHVGNGSLADWLFTDKCLKWQKRMSIACGVARALAYLHSDCRECVCHGDLTAKDVILDHSFSPKVTGFGLGRTRCRSDIPEWDVFRFGLLLLQIVSGRRGECSCGMEMAKWAYDTGDAEGVADVRMRGEEDEEVQWDEVERSVKIAIWCMQSEPSVRPSMCEVVKVLDGCLHVDTPPPPLLPSSSSLAGTCHCYENTAHPPSTYVNCNTPQDAHTNP